MSRRAPAVDSPQVIAAKQAIFEMVRGLQGSLVTTVVLPFEMLTAISTTLSENPPAGQPKGLGFYDPRIIESGTEAQRAEFAERFRKIIKSKGKKEKIAPSENIELIKFFLQQCKEREIACYVTSNAQISSCINVFFEEYGISQGDAGLIKAVYGSEGNQTDVDVMMDVARRELAAYDPASRVVPTFFNFDINPNPYRRINYAEEILNRTRIATKFVESSRLTHAFQAINRRVAKIPNPDDFEALREGVYEYKVREIAPAQQAAKARRSQRLVDEVSALQGAPAPQVRHLSSYLFENSAEGRPERLRLEFSRLNMDVNDYRQILAAICRNKQIETNHYLNRQHDADLLPLGRKERAEANILAQEKIAELLIVFNDYYANFVTEQRQTRINRGETPINDDFIELLVANGLLEAIVDLQDPRFVQQINRGNLENTDHGNFIEHVILSLNPQQKQELERLGAKKQAEFQFYSADERSETAKTHDWISGAKLRPVIQQNQIENQNRITRAEAELARQRQEEAQQRELIRQRQEEHEQEARRLAELEVARQRQEEDARREQRRLEQQQEQARLDQEAARQTRESERLEREEAERLRAAQELRVAQARREAEQAAELLRIQRETQPARDEAARLELERAAAERQRQELEATARREREQEERARQEEAERVRREAEQQEAARAAAAAQAQQQAAAGAAAAAPAQPTARTGGFFSGLIRRNRAIAPAEGEAAAVVPPAAAPAVLPNGAEAEGNEDGHRPPPLGLGGADEAVQQDQAAARPPHRQQAQARSAYQTVTTLSSPKTAADYAAYAGAGLVGVPLAAALAAPVGLGYLAFKGGEAAVNGIRNARNRRAAETEEEGQEFDEVIPAERLFAPNVITDEIFNNGGEIDRDGAQVEVRGRNALKDAMVAQLKIIDNNAKALAKRKKTQAEIEARQGQIDAINAAIARLEELNTEYEILHASKARDDENNAADANVDNIRVEAIDNFFNPERASKSPYLQIKELVRYATVQRDNIAEYCEPNAGLELEGASSARILIANNELFPQQVAAAAAPAAPVQAAVTVQELAVDFARAINQLDEALNYVNDLAAAKTFASRYLENNLRNIAETEYFPARVLPANLEHKTLSRKEERRVQETVGSCVDVDDSQGDAKAIAKLRENFANTLASELKKTAQYQQIAPGAERDNVAAYGQRMAEALAIVKSSVAHRQGDRDAALAPLVPAGDAQRNAAGANQNVYLESRPLMNEADFFNAMMTDVTTIGGDARLFNENLIANIDRFPKLIESLLDPRNNEFFTIMQAQRDAIMPALVQRLLKNIQQTAQEYDAIKPGKKRFFSTAQYSEAQTKSKVAKINKISEKLLTLVRILDGRNEGEYGEILGWARTNLAKQSFRTEQTELSATIDQDLGRDPNLLVATPGNGWFLNNALAAAYRLGQNQQPARAGAGRLNTNTGAGFEIVPGPVAAATAQTGDKWNRGNERERQRALAELQANIQDPNEFLARVDNYLSRCAPANDAEGQRQFEEILNITIPGNNTGLSAALTYLAQGNHEYRGARNRDTRFTTYLLAYSNADERLDNPRIGAKIDVENKSIIEIAVTAIVNTAEDNGAQNVPALKAQLAFLEQFLAYTRQREIAGINAGDNVIYQRINAWVLEALGQQDGEIVDYLNDQGNETDARSILTALYQERNRLHQEAQVAAGVAAAPVRQPARPLLPLNMNPQGAGVAAAAPAPAPARPAVPQATLSREDFNQISTNILELGKKARSYAAKKQDDAGYQGYPNIERGRFLGQMRGHLGKIRAIAQKNLAIPGMQEIAQWAEDNLVKRTFGNDTQLPAPAVVNRDIFGSRPYSIFPANGSNQTEILRSIITIWRDQNQQQEAQIVDTRVLEEGITQPIPQLENVAVAGLDDEQELMREDEEVEVENGGAAVLDLAARNKNLTLQDLATRVNALPQLIKGSAGQAPATSAQVERELTEIEALAIYLQGRKLDGIEKTVANWARRNLDNPDFVRDLGNQNALLSHNGQGLEKIIQALAVAVAVQAGAGQRRAEVVPIVPPAPAAAAAAEQATAPAAAANAAQAKTKKTGRTPVSSLFDDLDYHVSELGSPNGNAAPAPAAAAPARPAAAAPAVRQVVLGQNMIVDALNYLARRSDYEIAREDYNLGNNHLVDTTIFENTINPYVNQNGIDANARKARIAEVLAIESTDARKITVLQAVMKSGIIEKNKAVTIDLLSVAKEKDNALTNYGQDDAVQKAIEVLMTRQNIFSVLTKKSAEIDVTKAKNSVKRSLLFIQAVLESGVYGEKYNSLTQPVNDWLAQIDGLEVGTKIDVTPFTQVQQEVLQDLMSPQRQEEAARRAREVQQQMPGAPSAAMIAAMNQARAGQPALASSPARHAAPAAVAAAADADTSRMEDVIASGQAYQPARRRQEPQLTQDQVLQEIRDELISISNTVARFNTPAMGFGRVELGGNKDKTIEEIIGKNNTEGPLVKIRRLASQEVIGDDLEKEMLLAKIKLWADSFLEEKGKESGRIGRALDATAAQEPRLPLATATKRETGALTIGAMPTNTNELIGDINAALEAQQDQARPSAFQRLQTQFAAVREGEEIEDMHLAPPLGLNGDNGPMLPVQAKAAKSVPAFIPQTPSRPTAEEQEAQRAAQAAAAPVSPVAAPAKKEFTKANADKLLEIYNGLTERVAGQRTLNIIKTSLGAKVLAVREAKTEVAYNEAKQALRDELEEIVILTRGKGNENLDRIASWAYGVLGNSAAFKDRKSMREGKASLITNGKVLVYGDQDLSTIGKTITTEVRKFAKAQPAAVASAGLTHAVPQQDVQLAQQELEAQQRKAQEDAALAAQLGVPKAATSTAPAAPASTGTLRLAPGARVQAAVALAVSPSSTKTVRLDRDQIMKGLAYIGHAITDLIANELAMNPIKDILQNIKEYTANPPEDKQAKIDFVLGLRANDNQNLGILDVLAISGIEAKDENLIIDLLVGAAQEQNPLRQLTQYGKDDFVQKTIANLILRNQAYQARKTPELEAEIKKSLTLIQAAINSGVYGNRYDELLQPIAANLKAQGAINLTPFTQAQTAATVFTADANQAAIVAKAVAQGSVAGAAASTAAAAALPAHSTKIAAPKSAEPDPFAPPSTTSKAALAGMAAGRNQAELSKTLAQQQGPLPSEDSDEELENAPPPPPSTPAPAGPARIFVSPQKSPGATQTMQAGVQHGVTPTGQDIARVPVSNLNNKITLLEQQIRNFLDINSVERTTLQMIQESLLPIESDAQKIENKAIGDRVAKWARANIDNIERDPVKVGATLRLNARNGKALLEGASETLTTISELVNQADLALRRAAAAKPATLIDRHAMVEAAAAASAAKELRPQEYETILEIANGLQGKVEAAQGAIQSAILSKDKKSHIPDTQKARKADEAVDALKAQLSELRPLLERIEKNHSQDRETTTVLNWVITNLEKRVFLGDLGQSLEDKYENLTAKNQLLRESAMLRANDHSINDMVPMIRGVVARYNQPVMKAAAVGAATHRQDSPPPPPPPAESMGVANENDEPEPAVITVLPDVVGLQDVSSAPAAASAQASLRLLQASSAALAHNHDRLMQQLGSMAAVSKVDPDAPKSRPVSVVPRSDAIAEEDESAAPASAARRSPKTVDNSQALKEYAISGIEENETNKVAELLQNADLTRIPVGKDDLIQIALASLQEKNSAFANEPAQQATLKLAMSRNLAYIQEVLRIPQYQDKYGTLLNEFAEQGIQELKSKTLDINSLNIDSFYDRAKRVVQDASVSAASPAPEAAAKRTSHTSSTVRKAVTPGAPPKRDGASSPAAVVPGAPRAQSPEVGRQSPVQIVPAAALVTHSSITLPGSARKPAAKKAPVQTPTRTQPTVDVAAQIAAKKSKSETDFTTLFEQADFSDRKKVLDTVNEFISCHPTQMQEADIQKILNLRHQNQDIFDLLIAEYSDANYQEQQQNYDYIARLVPRDKVIALTEQEEFESSKNPLLTIFRNLQKLSSEMAIFQGEDRSKKFKLFKIQVKFAEQMLDKISETEISRQENVLIESAKRWLGFASRTTEGTMLQGSQSEFLIEVTDPNGITQPLDQNIVGRDIFRFLQSHNNLRGQSVLKIMSEKFKQALNSNNIQNALKIFNHTVNQIADQDEKSAWVSELLSVVVAQDVMISGRQTREERNLIDILANFEYFRTIDEAVTTQFAKIYTDYLADSFNANYNLARRDNSEGQNHKQFAVVSLMKIGQLVAGELVADLEAAQDQDEKRDNLKKKIIFTKQILTGILNSLEDQENEASATYQKIIVALNENNFAQLTAKAVQNLISEAVAINSGKPRKAAAPQISVKDQETAKLQAAQKLFGEIDKLVLQHKRSKPGARGNTSETVEQLVEKINDLRGYFEVKATVDNSQSYSEFAEAANAWTKSFVADKSKNIDPEKVRDSLNAAFKEKQKKEKEGGGNKIGLELWHPDLLKKKASPTILSDSVLLGNHAVRLLTSASRSSSAMGFDAPQSAAQRTLFQQPGEEDKGLPSGFGTLPPAAPSPLASPQRAAASYLEDMAASVTPPPQFGGSGYSAFKTPKTPKTPKIAPLNLAALLDAAAEPALDDSAQLPPPPGFDKEEDVFADPTAIVAPKFFEGRRTKESVAAEEAEKRRQAQIKRGALPPVPAAMSPTKNPRMTALESMNVEMIPDAGKNAMTSPPPAVTAQPAAKTRTTTPVMSGEFTASGVNVNFTSDSSPSQPASPTLVRNANRDPQRYQEFELGQSAPQPITDDEEEVDTVMLTPQPLFETLADMAVSSATTQTAPPAVNRSTKGKGKVAQTEAQAQQTASGEVDQDKEEALFAAELALDDNNAALAAAAHGQEQAVEAEVDDAPPPPLPLKQAQIAQQAQAQPIQINREEIIGALDYIASNPDKVLRNEENSNVSEFILSIIKSYIQEGGIDAQTRQQRVQEVLALQSNVQSQSLFYPSVYGVMSDRSNIFSAFAYGGISDTNNIEFFRELMYTVQESDNPDLDFVRYSVIDILQAKIEAYFNNLQNPKLREGIARSLVFIETLIHARPDIYGKYESLLPIIDFELRKPVEQELFEGNDFEQFKQQIFPLQHYAPELDMLHQEPLEQPAPVLVGGVPSEDETRIANEVIQHFLDLGVDEICTDNDGTVAQHSWHRALDISKHFVDAQGIPYEYQDSGGNWFINAQAKSNALGAKLMPGKQDFALSMFSNARMLELVFAGLKDNGVEVTVISRGRGSVVRSIWNESRLADKCLTGGTENIIVREDLEKGGRYDYKGPNTLCPYIQTKQNVLLQKIHAIADKKYGGDVSKVRIAVLDDETEQFSDLFGDPKYKNCLIILGGPSHCNIASNETQLASQFPAWDADFGSMGPLDKDRNRVKLIQRTDKDGKLMFKDNKKTIPALTPDPNAPIGDPTQAGLTIEAWYYIGKDLEIAKQKLPPKQRVQASAPSAAVAAAGGARVMSAEQYKQQSGAGIGEDSE